MSKAQTRTTERIESTVETVQIEEVQCPICEQWYADDGELVAVAVGATYEPDGEVVTAAHDTRVCTGCTGSLFGVAPESGRTDRVRAALSRPLIDLGAVSLGRTGRTVLSMAITLAIAGFVADALVTAMSAELGASEVQAFQGVVTGMLGVLPVVILILLTVAVVRAPGGIGGRFR